MTVLSRRGQILAMILGCTWLASMAAGCTELRGRRRIREGNRLYREGHYAEALEQYRAAEPLVPSLPLLWLNEGLTCRQLMIPGGRGAGAQRSIDCAIEAFDRLKQNAPADPRAEQLYVQTLFDGDRMETLAARYEGQLKQNPSDLAAVNGLVQVYSRWNRPDDALRWYERKAVLRANDPEAQYAVGVFIWQQLFQRGGGADKASFDPRPDPAEAAPPPPHGRRRKGAPAPARTTKVPPPFSLGDISGPARAALADRGIVYLERALALRPTYREAMVYLNLLYRQKSMAYFEDPDKWQVAISAAERWRSQAQGQGTAH